MNQVNQFECDEALLDRFLHNDLDPEQRDDLERHLDSCDTCARRLEDIAAERWTWREVTDCLPSDEFDSRSESDSLSILGITSSNAGEADNQALLSREISGWLDPTDDPDMLGRFAGYEIVGIIGHGGMGIVLKGFESSLNRYVAIKILAPRLATNGAARKRFAREAQAAAAVRHDNVIAVHRVDEWHGLPFLVMPYVAGISLQKRIDTEGPLSVEATLRIASQVASGLAAAHAQGLVHRDIKPANILLESGVERVTITDFGLARAIDDATITRTGIIAGTPQFMSPEQAQAKPLDHRSDLFSLGSLIYAMATGRPPFRSDNHTKLLRKIADSPARPVREIEPSIPSWLAEIINWLQEKSPDDRPQSAGEVAELISSWLAHLQQPEVVPEPKRIRPASSLDSPPPPARWRRRLVAVAGGLLAIMAGVILILETSKGTIRIECELDGVPIEVKKGDRVVESLTVSKDGASVRVAVGEYVVDVEGDIDGMIVRDGQVTMKRGDEHVVTIVQQARDAAAESDDGSPLGNGLRSGRRKEGIPGEIPPWERWEIRFSTTGVPIYAQQLDFFKIELGAVGGESPNVDYARNLTKSKPDRRSGKPEDEKRLYMTSQRDSATAEFDRRLIARAGITTQRRMVLQFYPKEIGELLARLEAQAARPAGYTDPKEILRTVFDVRSRRGGYEFHVIEQYYRATPTTAVRSEQGGDDGPDTEMGPRPETKPTYSGDQTQADLKRLQGGWELIAYEDADGRHPVTVNHEQHEVPYCIVIEGTKFTGPYFPHIGPPRESELELDANKSPKQLDLTADAGDGTLEISHMLYRFRGEHLELSLVNENARGLIPARFRIGKNSDNLITAVFKQIHHGEGESPAKTYTSEGALYTYGSRKTPSNAKPAPRPLSLLSDAIREFNQRQRQHSIGRHQPALTDDEVIAAIRRAGVERDEVDLSDDEFQSFQNIAETGLMPAGWSFEFLTDIELPDGSWVKVWSVRLTLDRGNGTGHTFGIRERALEYRPVAGQPAGESTDPVEGRISLADLVSEFNQQMQLSERTPDVTKEPRGTGPDAGIPTQPPVTVDEIVAAIRLQLNRESDRKRLSAAQWKILDSIAATRTAPKRTELEFFEGFILVAFHYHQWACRLMLSTSEGRFACNVRSQFLRSTEIPRVRDDQIAWGPPAKDGLQIGVQLAHVDAGRSPGEKYAPRFFFRNQTGKTVATFDYRIDYFEVDARTATGEKLPVKRRINNVGIDLPMSPDVVTGDERLESPGAPILIDCFDARRFEEAKFLNGNDPFTFEDPVAAVNAKIGTPIRLRFRLPYPANFEGPRITTGEIRVTVGTIADHNEKKTK